MTLTVQGPEGLRSLVGTHLGYSQFVPVTQDQVDKFAELTGDHQWIHVEVDRAATGPFGGTVAHGYMTLALAPSLLASLLTVEGFTFGVNYGCNRVRFPAPFPVGRQVRAGAQITSVEDVPKGVQAVIDMTFEIEGGEKPVCAAEVVYRYFL